ncbi:hypothetical protein P154DRAFT_583420 [Amniculicola lignicola CBS 123094]|uniref:Prenylcysteine lyase domain-containing protein n=1 Tax=Amniculicola lignicola CBS 123094 TaxID=1392246 RepID=A0A6A5VVT6_9PLEO|nr:hypothetical protein P154DRAFT_583420 [Amniculicola lignicola CBS 123094]
MASSSLSKTHQPDSSPDSALRVAIVGAGVAGASAAFHLHDLSRSAPISITIYESQSIVGGRVVSVPAQDTPHEIVEAGSPHFFTDDGCLTGAFESTGLSFPPPHPFALPNSVGLWNGKDIAAGTYCNIESPTWRNLARLIVRYGTLAFRLESPAWRHLPLLIARHGMSTWRFHQVLASTSRSWKILGVLHPFDNFSQALRDADLGDDIVFRSADNYLRELGISQKFLSEVVEPCTRARFSQNLQSVSALSALMATRRAKGVSVSGGNSRLIERMIDLSGADLRLNSTVVEIRNGDTRRYQLSVALMSPADPPTMAHTEYDIIILALPIHDENINLSIPGRSSKTFPALQSFAESHVTHFSTSRTISPTFFYSSVNTSIPDDLLTTAHSSNILSTGRSDVCFYSRPCLRDDECDQCQDDNNMYRVISRTLLSEIDLARLIGKQWREGQSLADIGISWVHRQAWSQALLIPHGDRQIRETGNIEIAAKLFHLGGVEGMLSSMEMSCRMGRNAARLLTRPGVHGPDVAHPEL